MKLIIPQSLAEEMTPRIREIAPDAQIVQVAKDGTPDGDLADADALLRAMSNTAFKRVLGEAPRLRWVHTISAGVDSVLLPELLERDEIVLTNSAGAHGIPISEFVLAMMLAHAKRLRELAALTPENAWPHGRDLELGELHGMTILVLGLGSIGNEVAKRAAAFGMRVWGNRRHPEPTEGVEKVVGEHEWRDLLPEVDYLVICTPLTNATRGMVDQAAFERVKTGAYLINIARGQIVETDALLEALHSGKLSGAALDTVPEEPLPADHPLWSAPNVWITPHISASSPQTESRSLEFFYENLRRFVAGEELTNIVDKSAGY